MIGYNNEYKNRNNVKGRTMARKLEKCVVSTKYTLLPQFTVTYVRQIGVFQLLVRTPCNKESYKNK